MSSLNPSSKPFPAAPQDAVSCYVYLLRELKVPASRITVSGDSAGGSLAISLLRYITNSDLPSPGAALIWSPGLLDMAAGKDPNTWNHNPNAKTDYLHGSFGSWGAHAYTADFTIDPSNPYLSPLGNPFRCETPIWIHVGGKEIAYRDIKKLTAEMKAIEGNVVECYVTDDAPHNIALVGGTLCWDVSAEFTAAGKFVQSNRTA